jgi:uncharacterized protein DUF4154
VIHPATEKVEAPSPGPPPNGWAVRWATAALLLMLCLLVSPDSGADGQVPISLQVRLLARLGSYDRNFRSRAGAVANILVVGRKADPDSAFEQSSVARALADLRDVGGVPIHVEEAELTDPEALAKRCRAERIAVLYLTVGLEADMPRLAAALTSGDILTVGTTARHAENGAVVGFALEQARPKLIINLPQAWAQNVDFRAEVLALARLVK